jgi:CRP-like cAMP-binding protein
MNHGGLSAEISERGMKTSHVAKAMFAILSTPFSYFGNNIGMTPSTSRPTSAIAAELLPSRGLSRQLAKALAEPLSLKQRPMHQFEKGVMLCQAGETVTNLPFIISGRLDAVVHVPGALGSQIVPIAFQAGEIAYLSYLFNQVPSGSDLVVGEPSAIRWVSIEDIEACLVKDPALLIMLVRFLGQRLREVQARERGWAARGVQQRLCAGLARMAADLPPRHDGKLIISTTHEQLAARCGISRPKASIALKTLEHLGAVTLGRRWIEVLDVGFIAKQAS